MGYISIQFNKAKGSADTGASDHIERKTIPKNADPTRTCLNRELVDFPDGVTNRTEAINHRIRTGMAPHADTSSSSDVLDARRILLPAAVC